jgi:hypothetical protein
MFARNATVAEWLGKRQYLSILISCYITHKENVQITMEYPKIMSKKDKLLNDE